MIISELSVNRIHITVNSVHMLNANTKLSSGMDKPNRLHMVHGMNSLKKQMHQE